MVSQKWRPTGKNPNNHQNLPVTPLVSWAWTDEPILLGLWVQKHNTDWARKQPQKKQATLKMKRLPNAPHPTLPPFFE
jgi:hypothetical protein